MKYSDALPPPTLRYVDADIFGLSVSRRWKSGGSERKKEEGAMKRKGPSSIRGESGRKTHQVHEERWLLSAYSATAMYPHLFVCLQCPHNSEEDDDIAFPFHPHSSPFFPE